MRSGSFARDFCLFRKNKNIDVQETTTNVYLSIAEKNGLIERRNGTYTVTDYGKTKGCYVTKYGGIGFAGTVSRSFPVNCRRN